MRQFFISRICRTFVFLILAGGTFFGTVDNAKAHDIPIEILEFLAESPNATDQEFEAFLASTDLGGNFEFWNEEPRDGISFNLPPELIDFLTKNPQANKSEILDFIFQTPTLKDTNWAQDIEILLSGNGFDGESPFSLNDLVLLNEVSRNVDYNTNSTWLLFAKNYIILGIQHIVGGMDHVLFILALVLVFPPWRRILAMVTVFTLAHSVTLVLGGADILTLSGQIVEPIIALSIAYVAITTVFLRNKLPWFANAHNRLMVIFAFGLFHGLGFAGVFGDVAPDSEILFPSLLFFNVGVEIGQILILVIALPILWAIYRMSLEKILIPIASLSISGISILWFLERILL